MGDLSGLNSITGVDQLSSQLKTYADKLPIDGYRVSLLSGKGFEVATHSTELESIEHTQDQECHIKVFKDNKAATASTSDLGLQALKNCIDSAVRQVEFTEADVCNGLPDASVQAGSDFYDCDLYHPWQLEINTAIEMTLELAERSSAIHSGVSAEDASLSTMQYAYQLFDSNGFFGSYSTTRHSRYIQMIAGDGDARQTDYAYTVARSSDDLYSTDDLANLAANKTHNKLQPKSLPTQRCDVLLTPEMARSFWRHIVSAISGGSLVRESSFLCAELGKVIAPSWLNIRQLPHIPRALASLAFDDEGVKTIDRDIIRNGVLESFILSSYNARRLGLNSTANAGGIQNWLVQGEKNQAQLLNEMQTGVLITDFMGQGVDITTGNYSRGAAGFWVENGVVQYPVHEFTLAGNIREFLQKLQAVGSDVDLQSSLRCGSCWISDVQLAGS